MVERGSFYLWQYDFVNLTFVFLSFMFHEMADYLLNLRHSFAAAPIERPIRSGRMYDIT